MGFGGECAASDVSGTPKTRERGMMRACWIFVAVDGPGALALTFFLWQ